MRKYIIGSTCAFLAIVTFNTNAEIMNADWKTAGDNLITRDTSTGLEWLDLTETNNMSSDYVLTQLNSGGIFEGWQYATSQQAVELWENFGINLPEMPLVQAGFDPGVQIAASYLGNTWCEQWCSRYPFGVTGTTSVQDEGENYGIGAVYDNEKDRTEYYSIGATVISPDFELTGNGNYLVRQYVVPIPAAVWLFGSGLIGLIGISRRKKS